MRNGLMICAVILLFAGAARSENKASASSTAEEIVTEIGRGSYLHYCATCHGHDAHGDGPVAAALKAAPVDLTRIAARREGKFPTTEIAALIDGRSMPAVHGTRAMPVWGRRFSDDLGNGEVGEEGVRGQLLVLVEYLRSIQR